MPIPRYRADIDGLRAIAVLSVVAYHAFPARMPGGFVGVDVFFVISGFLISSIVFSSLERNDFSLAEFYGRRIRRIFPALLLVLVASFAAGFWLLFADEYRQLARHVFGGAAFVSNFFLWGEGGYFDGSAKTKPLLHLWSLAIEEQFYVFWPLLLAAVWKRGRSFLLITAAVGAISFGFNILTIDVAPTASFYLPISRFWELMAGGLLAYVVLHRPDLNAGYRNAQSVIGVVLLLLSFVLIDTDREFPGWRAALPTAGAFLLVSAGPGAFLNERLLSTRPLVWVGLISYPLYLWHWSILSFVRIVTAGEPSAIARIAAVSASIPLAWLTYEIVEKPIRHGGRARYKTLGLVLSMLVVGSLGYYGYRSDGFPGYGFRAGARQAYVDHFENSRPGMQYFEKTGMLEKYRRDCDFYDLDPYGADRVTNVPKRGIDATCYERDPAYGHAVLIWGDSTAQQLRFGLSQQLPRDWQILQVASSGCKPTAGAAGPSRTDHCMQSNWFAMKTVADARPDVVIVAQADGHDAERLVQIDEELARRGVPRVIFVGPAPRWTAELPRIIARRLWKDTPRRTFVGSNTDVLATDDRLKGEFEQTERRVLVSLIDFFCNSDGCLTYLGRDRRNVTSWDHGHLTPRASDLLARELLADLVAAPGTVPRQLHAGLARPQR